MNGSSKPNSCLEPKFHTNPKTMKKIDAYHAELASYIPSMEKRNEGISASTVGWQIEHS
jgi:hypothetical protein